MKIFIDNVFKCHAESAEGLRGFDVPFFDGKCPTFIEGYRYVPDGETWHYNGYDFKGEMICPWKPYKELELAQNNYELQLQINMLKECVLEMSEEVYG